MSDTPQFSYDWQSPNFPVWDKLLPPSGGLSVLEIGCYEGLATRWFLQRYTEGFVTCVDTFEGGQDHKEIGLDFSNTEERFHQNISPWLERVSCYRGTSFKALLWFHKIKRSYDVALIDGSHLAHDVLSDAILAWPLMKQGGIVIFDDYGWRPDHPPESTPKAAIDSFLTCYKGQYELLEKGYQCLLKKL